MNKSMLFPVIVCCSLQSTVWAVDPPAKEDGIPTNIETKIRQDIYNKSILTTSPLEGKYAFLDIVVIPKSIEDAYKSNPKEVDRLLLNIAEGGRPEDSMKALAYLISLARSPAAGVTIIHHFDKDKYDEFDTI